MRETGLLLQGPSGAVVKPPWEPLTAIPNRVAVRVAVDWTLTRASRRVKADSFATDASTCCARRVAVTPDWCGAGHDDADFSDGYHDADERLRCRLREVFVL
jgi:hypothetical protein